MLKFTQAPFSDVVDVNAWPKWSADHCDPSKVISKGNQFVNTIIENAPLQTNQPVWVDVRTQLLMEGCYTLGLGWHTDGEPGSLHHLYIVGSNRTKFQDAEFPVNHYATYDYTVSHTAIEVEQEEFRLFVRIQEATNIVRQAPELLPYYPRVFTEEYPLGAEISADTYFRFFTERGLDAV